MNINYTLDFGAKRVKMRKKKIVKRTPVSASNKVITFKIDEVKQLVLKNSKDIEDLKAQVNMGKGGIKAIFAIGSLVAIILGTGKFFKFWG